jgi:hypothetical protein
MNVTINAVIVPSLKMFCASIQSANKIIDKSMILQTNFLHVTCFTNGEILSNQITH